ncbi:MAG: hypothetical protein DRN04_02970 [Thermoprotei archaeon]|nr:MAG: hypothetical protein DRN04_02970 [Thermoprotei archaeon]
MSSDGRTEGLKYLGILSDIFPKLTISLKKKNIIYLKKAKILMFHSATRASAVFLLLIVFLSFLPVSLYEKPENTTMKVNVEVYPLKDEVVYKVLNVPELNFVYVITRAVGNYRVHVFNKNGEVNTSRPYRKLIAYSSVLRSIISLAYNNSKILLLNPLNLSVDKSLEKISPPSRASTAIDMVCKGDKVIVQYTGAIEDGGGRRGTMIQVFSLTLGETLWYTRLKVGEYVEIFSYEFSPDGEYIVIYAADTLCTVCREWSNFIEIIKASTGEKVTQREEFRLGKSWCKALSGGVLISVENERNFKFRGKTLFVQYDGTIKWTFAKDDPKEKYYDAVEVGNVIIISIMTSTGEALEAVDSRSGSKLWRIEAVNTPAYKLAAYGNLILAANSGKVMLLTTDGKEIWEYEFGDGFSVADCLWIDENTFMVAKTSVIYLFKIEKKEKYTLSIKVASKSGEAILGAKVLIYNASNSMLIKRMLLVSNSSANIVLVKGEYIIQVKREGYVDVTQRVALTKNITLQISLTKASGVYSGVSSKLKEVKIRIIDLYGKPLVNMIVNIFKKVNNNYYKFYMSTKTDQNGFIVWQLDEKDIGTYRIVIPELNWSKEITVPFLPYSNELQVIFSEKYPVVFEAVVPQRVRLEIFNKNGIKVCSLTVNETAVVELKAGIYTIKAYVPGYRQFIKKIKVPEVSKIPIYLEKIIIDKSKNIIEINRIIAFLKSHTVQHTVFGKKVLAPDFKIRDIEGRPLSLKTFRNEIVILDFFYIGCHGCEDLIPLLRNLSKYDNVVIISIDVRPSIDTRDKLMNYMDRFNISWHIVVDTLNLADRYRVTATPTVFVIKDGYIVASFVGYKENIITQGPGLSKIVIKAKITYLIVAIAVLLLLYIIYEETRE